MDIRNVANQGNVERRGDRAKKPGSLRTVVIPGPARDEASISATGRGMAAAIGNLAARARTSDDGREALVADAMRKLGRGELDGEAVVAATATRLLDAKFFSV